MPFCKKKCPLLPDLESFRVIMLDKWDRDAIEKWLKAMRTILNARRGYPLRKISLMETDGVTCAELLWANA
jgi:hypothetical protein